MKHRFVTSLGLLCLTLLEQRILTVLHGSTLQAHLDVVTGIVSGHPTWKAYQNRLLGPEMVFWISELWHLPLSVSYRLFCFGALGMVNTVCYALFYRPERFPQKAWACTIAYAAFFVVFQDNNWLYLWDYIDLTVTLLFAWIVVFGRVSLWQQSVLYFLALLNRESAQFIALWIMIEAVQYHPNSSSDRKLTVNSTRLIVGFILGLTGTLWTIFIRNKLCIEQAGSNSLGESKLLGGQWLPLPYIYQQLKQSSMLTPVTILILLGLFFYFLSKARFFLGERTWQVALMVCAIISANVCFATMLEIRVWFIMLPLILCLACAALQYPAKVAEI